MSSTSRNLMITAMNAYFAKVKAAISASSSSISRYKTGTVPANGAVVIDAPTDLGFVVSEVKVYSLGIQLACVDPTITTNPPVVDAQSFLHWVIGADGKVTISNTHSGDVTYHMRLTMPVK